MTMKNPEKKKELKALLQKEKERIEKVLSEFTKKDSSTPGNFESEFPDFNPGAGDLFEMSSEVEEYENRLALEHSLEKRFQEIHDALELIDSDEYGKCEKCGDEISFERLKLNPATRLCVSCMK